MSDAKGITIVGRRTLRGTLLAAAMSIAIGLAVVSVAGAENVEPATKGAATGFVDDGASGWIWHGMVEYDDPAMRGGTAHAGGSGTYGAYTFRGTSVDVAVVSRPSITVDGRSHKIGRLKISIDGKPALSVTTARSSTTYDAQIYTAGELSSGLHVLQVEPDGGWTLIDYITVNAGASAVVDSGGTNAATKSGIPAGLYRIVAREDARQCLTTEQYVPADGTKAEIFHFDPNHMETWMITPLGHERYRIAPAGSQTECLAMLANAITSDTEGYKVGTWQTGDYPAAQWYLVPTELGYYRIASVADPNRVLDIVSDNINDATDIVCYPWHGANNEQWGLIPVK